MYLILILKINPGCLPFILLEKLNIWICLFSLSFFSGFSDIPES